MTNCKSEKAMEVEHIRSIYDEKLRNDGEIFKNEFEELNDISRRNSQKLEPDDYNLEQNQEKNRYDWIHGYRHSQVLLSGQRYVNASYVDGAFTPSKFIATQGPLKKTIEDFWTMVWEQNTRIIVMLANVMEDGHIRCDIYWPVDHPIVCSDLTVNLTSQECRGDYVKRVFLLECSGGTKEKENRKVIQLHYTSWPDRGVPTKSSGLVRLHSEMSREWATSQQDGGGPIVAHCSAGVGRTGTFICYDILCEEIDNGAKHIDVMHIIVELRKRRILMLQSLTQYIFVHNLMLEKALLPTTDQTLEDFLKSSKRTQGKCPIEVYGLLRTIPPIVAHDLQRNIANGNGVPIGKEESNTEHFAAKELKLSYCDFTVIATDDLKEQAQMEILRHVLEKGVQILITCDSVKVDYLWRKIARSSSFDDISVSSQHEEDHGIYSKAKLKLSSSDKDFNLTLFELKNWTLDGKDGNCEETSAFFNDLSSSQKLKTHNHAMILCDSKSIERCASICTILAIMERSRRENTIDVFRMIKDAREYIPSIADDKERLDFIYEAVRRCVS